MKLTHYAMLALGYPQVVARDNDPAPDGDPADTVNVADETDGIVKENKTFTQDDVNKIVVQRNKALKAQYEALEQNYQGLLEEKNLTQQQRAKIEADLQNVQAQLRTKEQQAAHEAKLAAEKHKNALQETEKTAVYYKNLYESSTIEREIVDAATQHGGYNPRQFIALVRPRTKLVEELNTNGEKTGRLVPRVEETVKGDDGSPTAVLRTVEEAILGLKETDPNLFKSFSARGIGNGTENGVGGKPLDPKSMSTADYFANRDQIRKQYGLDRSKPGN